MMHGFYPPDRPALRAHDHGMSDGSSAEETSSLEEVAVGDPRGCEHHVLAAGQVGKTVDPIDVDNTHLFGALDLTVVTGLEAPLHIAAQATDPRRGDHAFWRPTDTD